MMNSTDEQSKTAESFKAAQPGERSIPELASAVVANATYIEDFRSRFDSEFIRWMKRNVWLAVAVGVITVVLALLGYSEVKDLNARLNAKQEAIRELEGKIKSVSDQAEVAERGAGVATRSSEITKTELGRAKAAAEKAEKISEELNTNYATLKNAISRSGEDAAQAEARATNALDKATSALKGIIEARKLLSEILFFQAGSPGKISMPDLDPPFKTNYTFEISTKEVKSKTAATITVHRGKWEVKQTVLIPLVWDKKQTNWPPTIVISNTPFAISPLFFFDERGKTEVDKACVKVFYK
jgi:hypothetical protein